jgi:hypothetical protein
MMKTYLFLIGWVFSFTACAQNSYHMRDTMSNEEARVLAVVRQLAQLMY